MLTKRPNHATARLWYGLLLEKLDRPEEALAERLRALELDPLSVNINASVGDTLCRQGQFGRAVDLYKRALELAPRSAMAHRGLGWTYLEQGRRAEGMAELEHAAELSEDDPSVTAWLGHAYGLIGRRADADRVLRAMLKRGRQRYLSPFFVACVHAGLDDRDAAFARLFEAFDERSPILPEMKIHSLLLPLRADPRYRELLRLMNLP